eukprot:6198089-Amphidinium_carterae.1
MQAERGVGKDVGVAGEDVVAPLCMHQVVWTFMLESHCLWGATCGLTSTASIACDYYFRWWLLLVSALPSGSTHYCLLYTSPSPRDRG